MFTDLIPVNVNIPANTKQKQPFRTAFILERVTGIEPVSLPWQGNIITIIRYPPTLKLRRANPQKLAGNLYIKTSLVAQVGVGPTCP